MDLIISNGSVLTMDASNPRGEAVAIKDGRIVAVGSNEAILKLASEKTTIIDAKGKSVLPGFNDSHMHLYGYAMTKNMVELSRLAGIDELASKLKSYIEDLDPAEGIWIMGWGWDQTPYREERMPNRHDLDRVSTDHPMMLLRTCGHVCVLNTAGLQAAGIFEQPPTVEGGLVELDATGRPTGILKEKALGLVMSQFPEITKDVVKFLIFMAAEDFLKAGLTSIQTDDLNAFSGDPAGLFAAYLEMAAEGQLPLRVNEQMLLPEVGKLQGVLDQGYKTGFGGDYFKIGPLKLLMDGSLGGRSALLAEPYTDDPGNSGIAIFTEEQLKELVTLAHTEGMQVATHAIGDAAISTVLKVYREVQEEHPREDPRFRIIHASVTPPDLLDRFGAQGVIADVQPCFVPSDMPFIESRLGHKRAPFAFCYKEFLKRGIPLGGGSDCPVEDYRPLMGIHAAVNRQGYDGEPKEGWMPDQKLTLHEALYMYTMGSAFNSFEEDSKGSITVGKLADLVVLSDDIEGINPECIKELTVEKTIVGGKIAYTA